MIRKTLPRVTEKDIRLLESLDSRQRKEILCNTLDFLIKEEESAIPMYEDFKKSLSTYYLEMDVNDIVNPIIIDENKHKRILSGLASRMGCRLK